MDNQGPYDGQHVFYIKPNVTIDVKSNSNNGEHLYTLYSYGQAKLEVHVPKWKNNACMAVWLRLLKLCLNGTHTLFNGDGVVHKLEFWEFLSLFLQS
jgi:hypothetical protein